VENTAEKHCCPRHCWKILLCEKTKQKGYVNNRRCALACKEVVCRQSWWKQNKTKQDKTKQNKTKQNSHV